MTLDTLTFGSLFAGIGGFDLGLERAGMVCKWQVEIDPFCQKVLTKHWPDVPKFGDIKDVGKHNLEPVDLICGGFPCQPFSQAGERQGANDDRYLWPEMLRVIRELSPRWIIGENVAGFISMELENTFTDLEAEGYQVEAFVLPALAVNLPHERERIWIMAYPKSDYGTKRMGIHKNLKTSLLSTGYNNGTRPLPKTLPRANGVANGIPNRMDRLRSLGNAVVPQIPELLGRMIIEVQKGKIEA